MQPERPDGLYQRAASRSTPLLDKLADLTDEEWDELAHRVRKHTERALADKDMEVVPSAKLDHLYDAARAVFANALAGWQPMDDNFERFYHLLAELRAALDAFDRDHAA